MSPADVVRALWERMQDRDRVVDRVRVTLGEKLFHCLSFADVASDKIVRSVDFWVDDQGDEPPEWRAPYWAPKESS